MQKIGKKEDKDKIDDKDKMDAGIGKGRKNRELCLGRRR